MPKAHIRLAYRQLIDQTAKTPFTQQIFHATWSEYCIQQQSFSKGQPLFSWPELKATFPKSDPALPFKVSFSIAGLISALGGQIPGLQDTIGIRTIAFTQHRFELIRSNAKDISQHQVSLTYITPELTLFEVIGDQLLLSLQPPQTFMLKLEPGLSIISYQPALTSQITTAPQNPKTTPPTTTAPQTTLAPQTALAATQNPTTQNAAPQTTTAPQNPQTANLISSL